MCEVDKAHLLEKGMQSRDEGTEGMWCGSVSVLAFTFPLLFYLSQKTLPQARDIVLSVKKQEVGALGSRTRTGWEAP